jgi:hypothetical protein
MPLPAELAATLAEGTTHSFRDWPNPAVPTLGAGVYTIWDKNGRLIYVGMSGRGIDADTIHRNTPQGIYTRLQSHARGRRSGDQFSVYVADRLVLPMLSQRTSPLLPRVGIKWMFSYADTSTRTSAIDLLWCLTDRRHMRLKRRSSAVNGSTVARSSIREGNNGVRVAFMTDAFRGLYRTITGAYVTNGVMGFQVPEADVEELHDLAALHLFDLSVTEPRIDLSARAPLWCPRNFGVTVLRVLKVTRINSYHLDRRRILGICRYEDHGSNATINGE